MQVLKIAFVQALSVKLIQLSAGELRGQSEEQVFKF